MNGYSYRNGMWFGTQERAEWIPAPLQGADTSPQGWEASGTFLNGGSFSQNSFGSHKTYSFEFRPSSSPATAQLMHSYANGSFGRGPLYFIDPLTYSQNVLPARWADPSITLDFEGRPLRTNMTVDVVPTSGGTAVGLPVRSVQYSRAAGELGDSNLYPGQSQSVFIPIPEGMFFQVAAWYQAQGDMSVSVASVDASGNAIDVFEVPPSQNSHQTPSSYIVNRTSGVVGARVFISDWTPYPGDTNRSITIAGMRAVLQPIDRPYVQMRGWMGGMGHSGCSFLGKPTMQSNSPVEGGRMGFSAMFTEVGDWLYA